MGYTSKMMALRKTPPKSGDLQTGVWYSNYSRVKNYAIKNKYGFFAVWWSGDACPHCECSMKSMLNSTFKNWMKNSGLIFWFGCGSDSSNEDREQGTGYNELWNTVYVKNDAGLNAYPFWWFYWKNSSGKVKINKYLGGANTIQGDDDDAAKGAKRMVNKLKSIFSGYLPPGSAFSVTFKDWDGSVLKAAQTVKKGSSATPPSDPARTGYTFTGWEPGYQDIQANTVCVAQYKEYTEPKPGEYGDDGNNDDEGDKQNGPINELAGDELEVLPGQRKILVSNNVSSWQMIGDASGGYNDLKRSLVAVTIGENCTDIEPSCFYGCENLESVFMPTACRNVGDYAFYGCSNLKYITCLRRNSFPVNYLGNHAFDGCDSLGEICLNLSSGYYKVGVGEYCFANCMRLSSFQQYGSAYLGANMFSGCESLTSIQLPANTNYVFPSALANIPNLVSVELPGNIWFMSDGMFKDCPRLTSVVVRDTDDSKSVMNMVGFGVFEGCESLTDVELPRSINSLSCIDEGFLYGSSVSCVRFNGLSDSTFTTGKTVTVNFGSYQTGVKYTTEKDVKAVIALAKKYNVPVLMGMTNYVNANMKESPDYGYTPKGNYFKEWGGTCPHCEDWKRNVENTAKWQNWLKNSGYFYVVGGEGPFGHAQYDAKVKSNFKKNTYEVKEIYRYFDACKAQDEISKYKASSATDYFIMTFYWKQKNGKVKSKSIGAYGDSRTPAKAIKEIDEYFKGYDKAENGAMQYTVSKTLTTFGRDAKCIYISSTGKRYEITNTSYVRYLPEENVNMTEDEQFEYGTWYYNARQLREFADAHNVPVLIEYSSSGCDPCEYFKRYVYNDERFQKWVAESPYMFCRIETTGGQSFDNAQTSPQPYYVKNVWSAESPNYANQGIPVFMWYWLKPGETAASVWDIRSYHFNPNWAGAQPPFTMDELMAMTDQKFAGYVRDPDLNKYVITNLYSTQDVLIGRFYENDGTVANDPDGRHFSCNSKTSMGTQAFYVALNIKGYSQLPTYVKKGQAVPLNPGTYQYYTTAQTEQYHCDQEGCIFRVDASGSQNIVQYVWKFQNFYEDEPGGDDTDYEKGRLYELSADSSAETLEEIVAVSENTDARIMLAVLGADSDSAAVEQYLQQRPMLDLMSGKAAYFIAAKPASFGSGLGLSVKEFASDPRKSQTVYGEAGFPAWTEQTPAVYLYQGCATCVPAGMPALVELAVKLGSSSFASAQKLAQDVKSGLKLA